MLNFRVLSFRNIGYSLILYKNFGVTNQKAVIFLPNNYHQPLSVSFSNCGLESSMNNSHTLKAAANA